ncbi:MAG: ankyrin repeat domain-containing protein [Hyphomicrobiales bacterium]
MAQLHDAVIAGDAARVDVLINAGAPVDEKNKSGETALLLAVKHDKTAIAKSLMASGASIDARAKNKDTPWLLAGASGRTELIREMVPLGPDLSIRNRYGGNALIPACERGHVETIKVLLTTDIDVDHVNNLGWTCLLEIVILGDGGPRHVEAARLVLDAGANPNLADKDGLPPLAHARARGQVEVAALIEKAGGKS